MKRELFNIADEEFMTLLKRTHDGFEREGIPYMFVGGVANQVHVAKLICDFYNSDLLDIIESGKIRTQDYLRSTDDVDIVLKFGDYGLDEKKNEFDARKGIFSVLDYIVDEKDYFSPTENHVVNIGLERKAHVRPVFELGIDDVVDPDKRVAFNIFRGPKDLKNSFLKDFEDRFYDIFLNSAEVVNLPYSSNGEVSLKVKNKEHLIATKIALGRPKDINDALSLHKYGEMAGQVIDYPIVEHILCSEHSHYHVKSEELCDRYEAFRKLADRI